MIGELIVAGLGYVVAAFAVGLWWGERGRRMDAQRREGVVQVDRPKRAIVRRPDKGGVVPAEVQSGIDLAAARQRYIEDAVREGYDPEDAARDFDQIMARIYSDQAVTI